MPLLFASTLFSSAVLLFWIQPLIAKMLLPLLGGTPSVWNVCMVFFQAVLLGGYAYAHFTARWLTVPRQVVLHLGLLAAAFALLPVGVSETAIGSLTEGARPIPWLLGTLFLSVGFPFFVVSTTAPLLQRWFSLTGHHSAGDPYFLYGASNLGSLLALIGFPAVLEPLLAVQQQSRLWMAGFGVLMLLIAGCGFAVSRSCAGLNDPKDGSTPAGTACGVDPAPGITWRRRGRWVLWAFIPSSLMLGVTQYLTTDIATFPLLWVLPLALYLATFVLVFARRQVLPPALVHRALPIAAVVLLFLLAAKATQPIWLLMALHLVFFFVAALSFHGLLANDRPPVSHLTEFYFWMSGGGVLGGLFNALLAPVIFSRIIEYPLVIVLACLAAGLARTGVKREQVRWADVVVAAGLLVLVASLGLLMTRGLRAPVQVANVVSFGLPLVLAYLLVNRPVRFALALAAVLIGAELQPGAAGRTLEISRNFFGVSRVTLDATGRFHQLYHGNTVHGRQFVQPDRRIEPLSYYHRTGPLGQIFQAFNSRPASRRVALVGLGAGAAACYARPDQVWTIYEIDPAVTRIARDPRHFTYLAQCAAPLGIVLGDARLQLRGAPDGQCNLMVLDAFSSDAIPVHLLTREALRLYTVKLAPGGLLAFHISNRNLDLKPVLADLAAAEGLVGLSQDDVDESDPERVNGKDPSQWVAMARRTEDLGELLQNQAWQRLPARPKPRPWTDDCSNILTTLRWR